MARSITVMDAGVSKMDCDNRVAEMTVGMAMLVFSKPSSSAPSGSSEHAMPAAKPVLNSLLARLAFTFLMLLHKATTTL